MPPLLFASDRCRPDLLHLHAEVGVAYVSEERLTSFGKNFFDPCDVAVSNLEMPVGIAVVFIHSLKIERILPLPRDYPSGAGDARNPGLGSGF